MARNISAGRGRASDYPRDVGHAEVVSEPVLAGVLAEEAVKSFVAGLEILNGRGAAAPS